MQLHASSVDLQLFIESSEMLVPLPDGPTKVTVHQLDFIPEGKKDAGRELPSDL